MANRKSIAPQGYNIFRDTLSGLKKTVRNIQEHPYSDNDYLYIEAMGIINFMQTDLSFYLWCQNIDVVIERVLDSAGISEKEIYYRALHCEIDE